MVPPLSWFEYVNDCTENTGHHKTAGCHSPFTAVVQKLLWKYWGECLWWLIAVHDKVSTREELNHFVFNHLFACPPLLEWLVQREPQLQRLHIQLSESPCLFSQKIAFGWKYCDHTKPTCFLFQVLMGPYGNSVLSCRNLVGNPRKTMGKSVLVLWSYLCHM